VPDAEITIEVNPASITAEKLIIYRRAGINRLSVGIQSLNDKYLSLLGRKSNRQHNLEKLTLINRFFNNYSTDLIFAIPGQTLAEFKKDLNDLLKFEPPHISLYNLELHPGTKLYQQYQADKLEMPTEELDAEMYDLAAAELKKAAYNHYEISNYARQGYRARHNFIYWLYQPYLAAGPGAVSFNGNYRFQNKADLKNYLLYYGTANSENILEQSIQTKKPTRNSASEFQVRQLEKLTAKEKQAEFAFLALRTERGILLNEFQKRFKQDFKKVYQAEINSLKANQLIKEANNRIYLTNRGKKLANEVFIKFLP
jgi:oxygen-independent coproporphyrinogen-3 oxidase